jgi:hypothetical protein
LFKHRDRAIRAPLEGLVGKVEVNGVTYQSAMPYVVLKDEEVAAVMNYIFTSWGNQVQTTTEEEVATIRATTKYPSWEQLTTANSYAALPTPAEGWKLTAGPELPFKPVRLDHRKDTGELYILSSQGALWSWHPKKKDLRQLLQSADYIQESAEAESPSCLGLLIDRQNQLWLSSNQVDKTKSPVEAIVTVWRAQLSPHAVVKPELWMQTRYPRGIGGFNHGVSCLTEGPDGTLYLASGSRTDGNEAGKLENHYQGGEVPLTSCVWKLDPKAAQPKPEIWCSGLRNAYGLAWDNSGRLWATENGPDADRHEELNLLTAHAHYGFPYQYAHDSAAERPYPHTPAAPVDLKFTLPVMNHGPAAGGSPEKPVGTFDPHSCPSGFTWIDGAAYAPDDRGSFLVTRFGNLLAHKDSGFDLLKVTPVQNPDKTWRCSTHVIAAPLARPIDIIEYRPGVLYLAEYSRGLHFSAGLGLNGRLIELRSTYTQTAK